MVRNIILSLIGWYKTTEPLRLELARQFHLPVHACRFQPTCSEYMAEAVTKYGALKGLRLGIWRIMRCGPWSKPGHDPLK